MTRSDYAPPPRYARARSTYPPAYSPRQRLRQRGAVSCAWRRGDRAAVVLLFGRQLVSSFVPNVPQQVRQLVATPTTDAA